MPLFDINTTLTGQGDVGWRLRQVRKVKRTQLAWDRECQHAVDTPKKALCNAPVLALPDPEAKYCLHIEASQYSLHPVLSQMQDKAENVLGYFSHQ
jgi:hypothetical protein